MNTMCTGLDLLSSLSCNDYFEYSIIFINWSTQNSTAADTSGCDDGHVKDVCCICCRLDQLNGILKSLVCLE